MSEAHQGAAAPSAVRLPAPTRIHPSPPQPAGSHWIVRGLDALRHGRVPERVQEELDRVLFRAGSRYRKLRVGGFEVTVRRGAAWDVNAVNRIIGEQDYSRPGHEIRETDVVIDIGANIGCFSLVAGRAAKRGRVLAFEPDAENCELTRRNAAANGLTNVIVERCAVSGTAGTLRLYRGAHGPLHTVREDRLGAAEIADQVPALTLPQIMDRHRVERCGFLKMNCEGAEYAILYGTPPDYLARIDRIALEYHASPGEDKDGVARELAAFLERQGFRLFEFTDFVGFDCGYMRGIRRG